MTNKKIKSLAIAGFFFVFWLAILYAGADHPPPPGFIVLIILDLGCSFLVYYRVSTYIQWSRTKYNKRLLRVVLDGLVAGLAVALISVIVPGGGEPSAPPPECIDKIIWFAVLGSVGSFNSLSIYLLVAFLSKKDLSAGN